MGPVGNESEYAYRLRALVRYNELHGHMRVPYMFHVPWLVEWPQEFWGLWLGSVVHKIRSGRLYKDDREELKAAGFDFNPQANTPGHKIGWDVVKAALEAYKKQVGDLNDMSQKYVVPTGDDGMSRWPEATWGLKIGMILYNISKRGTHYKDKRQELQDMGVKYKAGV